MIDFGKYLKSQSGKLKKNQKIPEGRVAWVAPSNIAMIKYWGKRKNQIPINPSLSFSLAESVTHTSIHYMQNRPGKNNRIDYFFNDKPNEAFTNRIESYLITILPYMPFLAGLNLKISSKNTFPHSAGIASSASAFASIALGLCSIEQEIFNLENNETEFYRKASFLARLGSGSACRSVYGGWTIWGKHPLFPDMSNYYAVHLNNKIHDDFLNLCDAILIIDSGQKAVSSSQGHSIMKNHPFKLSRIKQAMDNLHKISDALLKNDERDFIHIVEQEALSLHALMMSTEQGYILMKPNTLNAIESIIQYRNSENIPVCFTLDAGPNIHLLYPQEFKSQVTSFIRNELIQYCENGQWIDDHVGNGPIKLTENDG